MCRVLATGGLGGTRPPWRVAENNASGSCRTTNLPSSSERPIHVIAAPRLLPLVGLKSKTSLNPIRSITPLLPLHRLTPRSPFSSVPSVSSAVQFPNLLIKITFELHLRHLRKKGLYPRTVS